MKLKHLIHAAVLPCALVLGTAHADDHVVGRHITRIGCHHVNGTCYVSLDGAAFGASENCANAPAGSNQFRFDNAETADGRRTYASLLAAFLSQRPVSVLIRGCSGQGVPSLLYYELAQQPWATSASLRVAPGDAPNPQQGHLVITIPHTASMATADLSLLAMALATAAKLSGTKVSFQGSCSSDPLYFNAYYIVVGRQSAQSARSVNAS